MREHLVALVYILFIAGVVFTVARPSLTAVAIAPGDFVRRRNLWIAITLIAFLSHSFWIYLLVAAIVLLIASQAEQNKTALYASLVFAVPAVDATIGGFGLLQQLFSMNHVRLLSFTVLLPAFLSIVSRSDRLRFGSIWPDKLLAGYLVVVLGVGLFSTTFTNALRHYVFVQFLEVFLPYYVASRSLRDLKSLRDVAASFVLAGLVLSATAVFESFRSWNLYTGLLGAMGVDWGYGHYVWRGGYGHRSQATAGHPIALGFVIAVAIGLAFYVQSMVPRTWTRRAIFLLLLAGLIAALSRGPWIGAFASVLVFVATGRGAGRQVAKYAVAALITIPLLKSVPGGKEIIDILPFIGTTESENVDYRERLIEVAFDAIWESPWFGGIDIYTVEGNEGLKQVGGFIDVVNTYIGVMLGTGFVGLSLFLGFFLVICGSVFRATKALPGESREQVLLGRALLATLAGIMVTILTVSSITVIPMVYWCVAGIAVAYARLVTQELRSAPAQGVAKASAAAKHRVDRPVRVSLRS